MKKHLLALFLILSQLVIYGQNLVSNASFKEFSSCPSAFGQMNATDWWIPTAGSSDYFNECNTSNLSVPLNSWGFQESTTGAYVGVSTFYIQPGSPNHGREYVQTAFTEPTLDGACYELSITYSAADEYGFSSGLGLLLSEGIPSFYIGQQAQLQKTITQEDNASWHTLVDYYLSTGGETHLTIGNFNDDENTSFIPHGIFQHASFYYIDSVSVNYFGIPSDLFIDLGEDVTLCAEEFPYTITSNNPDATNIWNTGEVGSSIEVDAPGVYYVVSNIHCDSGTDTIEIDQFEEPILDMPDTLICAGESLVFEFDPELGDFEWNNGSVESSITITEAGTYAVSVSHMCGVVTDEIVVEVLEPIEIPQQFDLELCAVDLPWTIDLSEFDNGYNDYQWSNGQEEAVIAVTSEGTYAVTISNNCFSDVMQFDVGISSFIPLFYDFTDTLACPDQVIQINPEFSDVDYLWQDGSTNPYYLAEGPGNYSLIVSNFCGINAFEFEIDPILEPILDLGQDVALCPGDSIFISGDTDDILWNTGVQAAGIWVKTEGTIIGISQGLCSLTSDTIEISLDGAPPQIVLPDSLSICEGESLTLSASENPSGIDFTWNTGSEDSEILVSSVGTYQVLASNSCGISVDSVIVTLSEPLEAPNLEDLYTICAGDTLSLHLQTNGNSFEWSTGVLDSFIEVFDDGLYYVSVTNGCYLVKDSFELQLEALLTPFALGADQGICAGEAIEISAPIYDGNYLWNTGEETTAISIDEAGDYWLSIDGNCNFVQDSITIQDLGTIPSFSLGSDLLLCDGDSATISVESSDPIDEIIWNNGSSADSIVVSSAGVYVVELINVCGLATDTIVVEISTEAPMIDLGMDQSLCQGESLLLDLSNFDGQIVWNTGEESPLLVVQDAGVYFADFSSSCGESSDTILVEFLSGPEALELEDIVSLCEGEVYQVELSIPTTVSILWNSGSTQSVEHFTENGFYWVDLYNSCGIVSDSFILELTPDIESFSLPEDIIICDESSYVIESGITQSDVDLNWSTGENTLDVEVSASEIYWLQVSNDCFTLEDSIELIFANSPLPFDLGVDDTICFGETILLDGFQGDSLQYIWQNNDNASEFEVTESGIYSLDVVTLCGMTTDEIEILVLPSEAIVTDVEDEYLLCLDETLVIDLSQVLVDGILWYDGSTEKIREFVVEGSYQLQLSNICTDTLISILFEQEDCAEGNIYIPNTFSPNDDGVNDLFTLKVSDSWEVQSFQISIYNRWGEQVFNANEIDFGWDGRFKEKKLNPAVFAYFALFEVIVDGESRMIQINGDVTIIK